MDFDKFYERALPYIKAVITKEDFIIGLGKKVLLANNFGMLWEEAQSIGFANISTPMAWLSLLAFSLQIYYDFSGYSTMAIGLGKMLGFVFPKNFNYPYISKSNIKDSLPI